jgi:hypothetical protein
MPILGFSPKSKEADTDDITLDIEEGGGGVGQSAFMTAFFDKVSQVHPGPSTLRQFHLCLGQTSLRDRAQIKRAREGRKSGTPGGNASNRKEGQGSCRVLLWSLTIRASRRCGETWLRSKRT